MPLMPVVQAIRRNHNRTRHSTHVTFKRYRLILLLIVLQAKPQETPRPLLYNLDDARSTVELTCTCIYCRYKYRDSGTIAS